MSIQAMKQALEALETVRHQNMSPQIHPAKVALRAAITEAEKQESVAITDRLVCEIIDEADRTFRAHQRGIRGQMVTVWDSKESHIVAAAIRLTHPQPAIPAWQPIETPPKEWGSYLIWHPKYGMETLWFQLKDGGNDGRKAGNWYDEEGDDDYPCNARVTHWMPLPSAPKEQK